MGFPLDVQRRKQTSSTKKRLSPALRATTPACTLGCSFCAPPVTASVRTRTHYNHRAAQAATAPTRLNLRRRLCLRLCLRRPMCLLLRLRRRRLTRHPYPTAARCAWSHRVLPSHSCRAAMRSSVRLAWIRLSTWLSTAVVLSAADALTRCYAFLLRDR